MRALSKPLTHLSHSWLVPTLKTIPGKLMLALAGLASLTASVVQAQIGIGSIQDFNIQPVITEWATASLTGAAGDLTTPDAVDAAVQGAVDISLFGALPATTGNPPGQNALARWSSTGFYVTTRPTGVGFSVLAATLVNSTASDIPTLILSYDLAGTPVNEDAGLEGHRSYYSLSGLPNSWTLIPDFTTGVAGSKLASLSLGSWAPGSALYVIWVDDNGVPGTDGGFNIDNFLAGTGVALPEITRDPVGTNVVQGRTISLVVAATGAGLSYSWAKVGGAIDPANPTINTPNLVINNAALSDAGDYFCVVANTAGSDTSANATVNVSQDFSPPQYVSAVGDPFNALLVTVTFDESLCFDATACGTDASFNFSWSVSEKGNPAAQLGVLTVTSNNLNVVTLETGQPRTPGVTYVVRVFADSVGDLFGNTIPESASIDIAVAAGFRQGVDGYAGTQDAELHSDAGAATPLGGAMTLTVDNVDAGVAHALLRFDNIFGTLPNQIPPGSLILSATLSIYQNDPGDTINFHRMLVDWNQADVTWDSMVNGITADGAEAATAIDATYPANAPDDVYNSIDVKTTVQAWSDGAPNFGWGLIQVLPGGGGWDMNTSESGNPPSLVVIYQRVPCTTAPAITQQPPATVNALEGSSFSITVAATACEPTYQWTKDGADIPGANQATYTATAVAGAGGSAGQYRLRITNPHGTVTSSASAVTVANDTTRPRLLAALTVDGTTITLRFSKVLDQTSAETEANYTLTPSVAVNSAVLDASGTNVTLTTGARALTTTYSLRIAGVTDNRLLRNAINPNPTTVTLTGSQIVMAYSAGGWSYATNSQDATLAVVPWYAPGFVPGPEWWSNGQGMFGLEPQAATIAALPAPIVTRLEAPIDPDLFLTAYFRQTVTLPALPAGAQYLFCAVIDDGAVIYVDGVEATRINMPATSPVLYADLATAAAPEAEIQCFSFAVPAGTHTLAVEVHQSATTSSDVVFGAEIRIVRPTAPRLNIATGPTGDISVTWQADSAYGLRSAADPSGPYAPVAGNPFGLHTIPAATATTPTFFRLQLLGTP